MLTALLVKRAPPASVRAVLEGGLYPRQLVGTKSQGPDGWEFARRFWFEIM
jgi:hypothetical protein